MQFDNQLHQGVLIKRYKRFLADIELESGEIVTAHCANPGSMIGLKDQGLPVWLTYHEDPKRKLKYTWQLTKIDNHYVGINTHLPNRLAEEAIKSGVVPELANYASMKREVKYGVNSKIDILLNNSDNDNCYVEIKNVHLKRGTFAEFPDAVTKRGTKHLRELQQMVQQGNRAVMLYVIQRDDSDIFKFADDIDPEYASTAKQAFNKGVEAYAYACKVSLDGINIYRKLLMEI